MKLFVALTVALIGLSIAYPALAEPCKDKSDEGQEIRDGFYLVAESCGGACTPIFHIYEETGEHEGLQRKDRGEDNTCHGAREPDMRII